MLDRIYRWILPDSTDVMPRHEWPYYANWADSDEWRWGYFTPEW